MLTCNTVEVPTCGTVNPHGPTLPCDSGTPLPLRPHVPNPSTETGIAFTQGLCCSAFGSAGRGASPAAGLLLAPTGAYEGQDSQEGYSLLLST